MAVNGFQRVSDNAANVVLRNDRFELTVYRRPLETPRPAIGLTATWDDQPNPVVLAEVTEF